MALRKKIFKNMHKGFTTVEILAAVAILAILGTVGVVAAAQAAVDLRVAEVDNMARAIYMAAEDRAVALSRDGKLTEEYLKSVGTPMSVSRDGEEATLYYVKSPGVTQDVLECLLPSGSVDPSVRDAGYYIVYDPAAGCVTDVFFDPEPSTENFTAAFSSPSIKFGSGVEPAAFPSFYRAMGNPANASWWGERARNKIFVGHYGGEGSAIPDKNPDDALASPVEVKPVITIVNGSDLVVRVETGLSDNHPAVNGWELKAELSYGSRTIRLPLGKAEHVFNSSTWSWTIDSLDGIHFSDIMWAQDGHEWDADSSKYRLMKEEKEELGVADLSGTLHVSAVLVKKDAGTFVGIHAPVVALPAEVRQANAMYGESGAGVEGDAKTVAISNARHLQNLDSKYCGITGPIEVFQIRDIDVGKITDDDGNTVMTGYKFKPIYNPNIVAFNGGGCAIRNLTVEVPDGNPEGLKGAGLFASVSGTAADHFKFSNVQLVNASVSGRDLPAGSLVGTASNADFDGCRVYWDDAARLEDKGKLQYAVSSSTAAGGLAGTMTDSNVTLSFAATTVEASNKGSGGGCLVGGLAGTMKDASVNKSYADCYIRGEGGNLSAGGLAGTASSTSFENVYSTGFIEWTNTDETSCVAGFVANGSSVTVEKAYSGVYYQATGDYANKLAGGGAVAFVGGMSGNVDKCYAAWGAGSNGGYEGIKSDAELLSDLGPAFESKYNPRNSHPYRLGKNSGLGNYEAPGIVGLPHYGDWANGNQGGLPVVWVEDGEELVAYIEAKGNGMGYSNIPHVQLYYGDKQVGISPWSDALGRGIVKAGSTIISNTESAVLWKVVLDSVDGPHFKDWWASASSAPSSFGGDFSVVASTNNTTWTKKSAKSSANSLFASGTVVMAGDGDGDGGKPVSESSGKTAYVANLRHLQNLDSAVSGVEGKTAAVQVKDIDAGYLRTDGEYTGYGADGWIKSGQGYVLENNVKKRYAFKPINAYLQSYTANPYIDENGRAVPGRYCAIRNLNVTAESAAGKSGAGLFESVRSTVFDEGFKPFRFVNVRLHDASINIEDKDIPAGGLAGSALGVVDFTNCVVGKNPYADAGAGEVTSKGIAVSGGGNTGGLAGNVSGSVTFTGCSVSDSGISSSGKNAGGYAGSMSGTVGFDGCSASGTKVSAGGDAGGFAGNASGAARFENCTGNNITVSANGQGNSRGYGGFIGTASGGLDMDGCRIDGSIVKNADVKSAEVSPNSGSLTAGSGEGGFRDSVGGLAGSVAGASSFKDCFVGMSGYVNVWGADCGYIDKATAAERAQSQAVFAGGMVGYIKDAPNITGCGIVNASVLSVGNRGIAGGLAGFARDAVIKDCTVGDRDGVSGTVSVEGSSQYANPDYAVKDIIATMTQNSWPGYDEGARSNQNGSGGMVGYAIGGVNISDSSVAGNVKIKGYGLSDHAGGFIGFGADLTGNTLSACRITGNADGSIVIKSGAGTSHMAGHAGGMIGFVRDSAALSDCTAEGITVKVNEDNRTGFRGAGGLVGFAGRPRLKVTHDGKAYARDAGGSLTLVRCSVIDSDMSGTGYRVRVGGLAGYAPVVDAGYCTVNGVNVRAVFASNDGIGGNIKNEHENTNDTAFAGGMLGTSALHTDGTKTYFRNCSVIKADVYGKGPRVCAGGISGLADSSSFENCTVSSVGGSPSVKVYADSTNENANLSDNTGGVGGIAGYSNDAASFVDCAVVNVKIGRDAAKTDAGNKFDVGGVIGSLNAGGAFTRCSVGGDSTDKSVSVTGSRFVGGIAGFAAGSTVFDGCIVENASVSSVNANESAAGGVIGKCDGKPDVVSCTVVSCMVRKTEINANHAADVSNPVNFDFYNKGGHSGGIAGFVAGGSSFRECTVEDAKVGAVHVKYNAAGGILGKGIGNSGIISCTVRNTVVSAKNNTEEENQYDRNIEVGAGYLAGIFNGTISKHLTVNLEGCVVENVSTDVVLVPIVHHAGKDAKVAIVKYADINDPDMADVKNAFDLVSDYNSRGWKTKVMTKDGALDQKGMQDAVAAEIKQLLETDAENKITGITAEFVEEFTSADNNKTASAKIVLKKGVEKSGEIMITLDSMPSLADTAAKLGAVTDWKTRLLKNDAGDVDQDKTKEALHAEIMERLAAYGINAGDVDVSFESFDSADGQSAEVSCRLSKTVAPVAEAEANAEAQDQAPGNNADSGTFTVRLTAFSAEEAVEILNGENAWGTKVAVIVGSDGVRAIEQDCVDGAKEALAAEIKSKLGGNGVFGFTISFDGEFSLSDDGTKASINVKVGDAAFTAVLDAVEEAAGSVSSGDAEQTPEPSTEGAPEDAATESSDTSTGDPSTEPSTEPAAEQPESPTGTVTEPSDQPADVSPGNAGNNDGDRQPGLSEPDPALSPEPESGSVPSTQSEENSGSDAAGESTTEETSDGQTVLSAVCDSEDREDCKE